MRALVAAFALLLLAACEGEPPKTALGYTADAKRAYEAALDEFNAHNWIDAQAMMREVKRKYSYSKYARLAEKTRLLVRAAWKHAHDQGAPPPRRIVRWRPEG